MEESRALGQPRRFSVGLFVLLLESSFALCAGSLCRRAGCLELPSALPGPNPPASTRGLFASFWGWWDFQCPLGVMGAASLWMCF